MRRVMTCLIPFVCASVGAGCGPACTEDNECAVGAYCSAAGDCESKSCEPSEGNALGPDGFVRFCECVGDVLHWQTGRDDGACTFGCQELTWTPESLDCAISGTECVERPGVGGRPVVGCKAP